MHAVQAIEENFFTIARYWGALNSTIFRTQSTFAMATGVPVADLNWAWNEKPLIPADKKEIKKTVAHYLQEGLPFWWWIYPSGGGNKSSQILKDNGLKFLTAIPYLSINVSAVPQEKLINNKLKIVLVKNADDLSLWEKLSFKGFEFSADAAIPYERFVSSFDIGKYSPQKLFLVYLEGLPIASSLIFCNKNTAGIYFVSTLPAYRNRGIGLALTNFMIRYAHSLGLSSAILQASEDGLGVYKRAGFREYGLADVYSNTI